MTDIRSSDTSSAAAGPQNSGNSGIAQWDQRFASTDDFVFGTEPNLFLASQVHRFKPGMQVLSIADGEGRNGVWLAQQGLDVTTVEGSAVAVQKAARLAAERGVQPTLLCADITEWEWGENRYDAVVAIFIQFCGPELRRQLFDRALAALKPGGLFILQGYRPEQLEYKTGGPSALDNLYTEEQLRTELAGFEFDHLVSHDSELNEGSGHRGLSAVIDVVARKPV